MKRMASLLAVLLAVAAGLVAQQSLTPFKLGTFQRQGTTSVGVVVGQ